MKAVGIIPARLASRRLAKKVLKPISGRPLLSYTWQRAKSARSLEKVIIACCEEEVKKEAQGFGAEVVMTNPKHKSGTDRVAEVAKGLNCDIVLNIQADEPLIRTETLDKLVSFLRENPDYVMASIAFATKDEEQLKDPNVVKVVVDKENNALYFSRSLIPYKREDDIEVKYLKHIGIYAYRKDFLLTFSEMKESFLEKIEKLEQLRALEDEVKIKIIEINYDTIAVDTQEDFEQVEKRLVKE